MTPVEADAQASLEARFARLHDATLAALIDILERGVPIQKPSGPGGAATEIGRSPPPPAYISAAIRLLKDAGYWAGAGSDAELEQLLDGLPDFDA